MDKTSIQYVLFYFHIIAQIELNLKSTQPWKYKKTTMFYFDSIFY
jgi:hypothetical protein